MSEILRASKSQVSKVGTTFDTFQHLILQTHFSQCTESIEVTYPVLVFPENVLVTHRARGEHFSLVLLPTKEIPLKTVAVL